MDKRLIILLSAVTPISLQIVLYLIGLETISYIMFFLLFTGVIFILNKPPYQYIGIGFMICIVIEILAGIVVLRSVV
jgi:hypothetical protein